MEEKCNDCYSIFNNEKSLLRHQEIAKYCQQYKHVIFTCSKCLFSTKGIKNINSHIESCNITVSESPVDPISTFQKRILELEEELKNFKNTNSEVKEKLSTQIRLEKFKNKIYSHLIEENTHIKISDILTEEEDGIHVYNGNSNIPIYIHDIIKNKEGFVIKRLSSHKDQNIKILKRSRSRDSANNTSEIAEGKKQSYRSIKSCIPTVSECSVQDLSIKFNLVDSKNEKILEDFGNLEEAKKNFNECFEKLKQSRVYTKILEDLSRKRMNIFARMPLSDYQNLVSEHIRTIEDIFREKNYTDKKSIGIISKGLTSLESRLISYGNYTQSHLEIDEIEKLDKVLDLGKQSSKQYTIYNSLTIFNCFYNYGVILFPIKKNLERYLFNSYDLWNIIYLPLPKNTDDDPYSFYVLDRLSKEKRYWKMDCRLEDLSSNLIANLLPYMISMFRKLYRDVFGDNDFRKDYSSKCQITECDCEQLLQNIITVGQPKDFYNIVRTIVKNKATYTPTENDKFNLYGDDSLQRKRFHDKEDIDLVDIIKQLFDDISSEEAVDFYRSRTI
jgi:hypothetical protein